MNFKSALKKALGINNTKNQSANKSVIEQSENSKKYNILLLTNRDSDNVGDQVIEACDIALISTAMNNLGISNSQYEVNSQKAAIITPKYISTRNPELLKNARKLISNCDVLIFGGAPMFNYKYQAFYERTAITIELAQEYNKPVIFSAIGIESYDEDNQKCQRLKKALNLDCVQQITTRDDFELLQKYKENENLVIDKVADPAVFSKSVFKNQMVKKKQNKTKKVGVFILRAKGFTDNNIDFSKEEAAHFWKDLTEELENNGYNYDILTSGHFADEAFIDNLIRDYGVNGNKCVLNINAPDKLIKKISSYDAVISCRLHPSIISFALDIPSIGIAWNPKVKGFYSSFGYENRVVNIKDITPSELVKKLGEVIDEGLTKDNDYLASVYNYLFSGLNRALAINSNAKTYSYSELVKKIPPFKNTSFSEYESKLRRKFRRAYRDYNNLLYKDIENQKTIKELKQQINDLKSNTQ